jgi:predicted nuclease of predicted toxin-antitoxin system
MKFLADMNVSMSTVRHLLADGHDAVHLREQGLERLSDAEIIEKAREEGRVIITFDLDFGDLMAAGNEVLPSIVIFRLSEATPSNVSLRLSETLQLKEAELAEGAIVIVEDARYRTRLLPVFRVRDES